MSKQDSRIPLFLFLLGVLAFNLSAPPGHKDGIHETWFASTPEFASTCSRTRAELEAGLTEGSCTFTPSAENDDLAGVTGTVKLMLTDIPRWNDDYTKVDSTRGWKATLCIVCKDSEDCPEECQEVSSKTKSLNAVIDATTSDYKTRGAAMANRKKQARTAKKRAEEKLARMEDCEINKAGKTLTGGPLTSCQLKKLKKMDEDDASDYFEDHMRGNIEKMVNSGKPLERARGLALLKQIDNAHLRNKFINQNLVDLTMFAGFRTTYEQTKAKVLAMAPNDPNRFGALQQMQYAKSVADSYFQGRGLNVVEDQTWPMNGSFDYLTAMTGNLQQSMKHVDDLYATILQQHHDMMKYAMAGAPQTNVPVQPWNAQAQQQFQVPPPPQSVNAPIATPATSAMARSNTVLRPIANH